MSLSPTPLYVIDRASGDLDAQLLSALGAGGVFTFTPTPSTPLGTQSYNMPGGQQCVLTLENEHILLSAMTIGGGIVTCTIAARGYDNTSAATHPIHTTVNFNVGTSSPNNLQTQITAIDTQVNTDDAAILNALIYQSTVTTITGATTHTIAGDQTAIFKVGRHFWFQVVATWYRGTIVTVAFAAGTTTITMMGNSLPGAGVVVACGFEFLPSIRGFRDVQLNADLAADPVVNPPAGANWFYFKLGLLKSMTSAGTISTYLTTNGDTLGSLTAGENITAGQPLYVKASDGKAWRSISTGDESTYSFIGIASVTVLAAATVTFWKPGAIATIIVTAGAVAAGDYLYLTDTAGTLDKVEGSRIAKVAQAMSQTSARVIEPKFIYRTVVSYAQNVTGAKVLTPGFRAMKATCYAVVPNGPSNSGVLSIGDDTNNCVSLLNDNSNVKSSVAAHLWNLTTSLLNSTGDFTSKTSTTWTFTVNTNNHVQGITLQFVLESL